MSWEANVLSQEHAENFSCNVVVFIIWDKVFIVGIPFDGRVSEILFELSSLVDIDT